MTSALRDWETLRLPQLDELALAHHQMRRVGRSTEQLNFAYVLAVAAQLQGFCRELHSDAVGVISKAAGVRICDVVEQMLTRNRKLDHGNANAGNIADDFSRIGMAGFWDLVAREGGARRMIQLERLNIWRNAIAHSSFNQHTAQLVRLGAVIRPRLIEAKQCRAAVSAIARHMAKAVSNFLNGKLGRPPW